MPGERGWDGALLKASTGAIVAARLGVAPFVVCSGPDVVRATMGCLGVLVLVLALRARPSRSGAAPLLEDAVWLLGVAGVGLVCHGGSPVALVCGVAAGVAFLGALLVVQWAYWGRASGFWISARPEFQVFAPNPDNRYAMGRIHVGRACAIAVVPDNGSPYPAIGVYDTRFRRVCLARWQEVRALFDAHGELRVHVGLERDPTAGHLSFAVPPGRYFLTVRNYLVDRPEDPALPRHLR